MDCMFCDTIGMVKGCLELLIKDIVWGVVICIIFVVGCCVVLLLFFILMVLSVCCWLIGDCIIWICCGSCGGDNGWCIMGEFCCSCGGEVGCLISCIRGDVGFCVSCILWVGDVGCCIIWWICWGEVGCGVVRVEVLVCLGLLCCNWCCSCCCCICCCKIFWDFFSCFWSWVILIFCCCRIFFCEGWGDVWVVCFKMMGGLVMLVGCGGWIEFIVVSVIVVGKEMVDEFVWLKLIKLEKFIFEFIFMEIFGLIEGGLELFIVMGMDFVLVECKLFFIWVVRILVEGVMFIILGDKGLKILFLIVGDIGGEVEDMDISFEVERIAGDDDDMGRDWTFTIVWIGNFFMFVLLFVFELGVILMFRYGFSFLISWGFGLDIVKFRFLSLVFKFVIFMFFRFMRGLFMFLEEFFVFCNIGRVFCIVVFCCCFFGIMDCNCIEGWSCIIVFVWIKGLFCIGDVWIGKELWSCVIIGVGLVIMLDFICVADGLDDCIWIFDWVWRDICGWVCIMGCFCSWVCIWIWGWVWMMVVWVGFMGCCIIIGGEVSLGCFCMLVCVFIGLGEDIGIGEVSNGTVFGLFVCICIEFGCLVLICWDEIIIGRLDVELGFLDWNFNCYCKNNCCCCSMMW